MEDKDHPGAVDMPALREAIRAAKSELREHSLLIVEGFLLLQDAEVMEEMDAVLFLVADFATGLNRRLHRSKHR